ncbi:hypothetical protein A2U01_0021319, partial [Trifolium medium]|nr:hypothetical protein [Trifolium medium]
MLMNHGSELIKCWLEQKLEEIRRIEVIRSFKDLWDLELKRIENSRIRATTDVSSRTVEDRTVLLCNQ